MNIYLKLSEFKNDKNHIELKDNIRYLYPKKNNIMEGDFTKIMFSKGNITLNGIYLYLPLSTEKKITSNSEIFIRNILNTSINCNIVQDLKNLEKSILDHYQSYIMKDRQPDAIIAKQLSSNQIRVYHDNTKCNTKCNKKKNNYVIKISGIWETNRKFGLTYKIMEL